jgi:hypothetical protein
LFPVTSLCDVPPHGQSRAIMAMTAALGTISATPAAVPDAVPAAGPGTRVTVIIDGAHLGPAFQGIGAISGGGGNSRLLIDYPPGERGLWSRADVGYVVDWLRCARRNGLSVSYVGGWNEHDLGTGDQQAWFVNLRTALDAAGSTRTRIVAADEAPQMAERPGRVRYSPLLVSQTVAGGERHASSRRGSMASSWLP